MTSLSSLSPSRPSQNVVRFLALLATLALGACEDKHIGRPCDLGLDMPPEDPKLATVNAQALECPSRLCLQPAKDKSTDTGPLCTDTCGSDDDCSDGEKGSAVGDPRCDTGFVCRRVIENIASNPLRCKPVCVCKDFLLIDDPNIKPKGCP
jgi:hypothetical protein